MLLRTLTFKYISDYNALIHNRIFQILIVTCILSFRILCALLQTHNFSTKISVA